MKKQARAECHNKDLIIQAKKFGRYLSLPPPLAPPKGEGFKLGEINVI